MSKIFTSITNALTNGVSRERVCEACGRSFVCGASLSGCWCSEIELTDEARAELRNCYGDCLCRDCLSAHSVAAKQKRAVGT